MSGDTEFEGFRLEGWGLQDPPLFRCQPFRVPGSGCRVSNATHKLRQWHTDHSNHSRQKLVEGSARVLGFARALQDFPRL